MGERIKNFTPHKNKVLDTKVSNNFSTVFHKIFHRFCAAESNQNYEKGAARRGSKRRNFADFVVFPVIAVRAGPQALYALVFRAELV